MWAKIPSSEAWQHLLCSLCWSSGFLSREAAFSWGHSTYKMPKVTLSSWQSRTGSRERATVHACQWQTLLLLPIPAWSVEGWDGCILTLLQLVLWVIINAHTQLQIPILLIASKSTSQQEQSRLCTCKRPSGNTRNYSAIPIKLFFLSSFRDNSNTTYQNYQLRIGFCCQWWWEALSDARGTCLNEPPACHKDQFSLQADAHMALPAMSSSQSFVLCSRWESRTQAEYKRKQHLIYYIKRWFWPHMVLRCKHLPRVKDNRKLDLTSNLSYCFHLYRVNSILSILFTETPAPTRSQLLWFDPHSTVDVTGLHNHVAQQHHDLI